MLIIGIGILRLVRIIVLGYLVCIAVSKDGFEVFFARHPNAKVDMVLLGLLVFIGFVLVCIALAQKLS